MVDVYHEFSQPQKMLQRMREALKPGGRLALFEYRAEDPDVPILPLHKMTKAQVKTEVELEGLQADAGLRRPALAAPDRVYQALTRRGGSSGPPAGAR